VERGQATVETAALWGLIALILAIVALLLGPGLARDLARLLGGALPHPSGASAWMNDAGNRALVERAVAQLRDTLL